MHEGGNPLASGSGAPAFRTEKDYAPVPHRESVGNGTQRFGKIQQSLAAGYPIRKIAIPSYHVADDVVVYEVDVSNKKLRWNLWLRFESFYLLHQMLKELVDELTAVKPQQKILLPPFPEKRLKLIVDHFDEEFIEQRRCLLENYCRKILKNPSLNYAEVFLSFLTPAEDEDKQGAMRRHAAEHQAPPAPASDGDSDDERPPKKATTDSDSEPEDPVALKKSGAGRAKRDEPLYVTGDDEITSVSIPSSQILKSDHTIYQIHCCNCNKRESFSEWTVLKRFAEFHEFDASIRTAVGQQHGHELTKLPKLPPRYLPVITDHLDETFIERRRLLLQLYLRRLIRYPVFRRHNLVLDFLGVYSH